MILEPYHAWLKVIFKLGDLSNMLVGTCNTDDVLKYVLKSQEQIGWRDRARRMLVYATDAGFHIAGDGKV